MPRERVRRALYVVQQHTGEQYGWEDVHASNDRLDARDHKRIYRRNQPEFDVRIVTRFEKLCKTCQEWYETSRAIVSPRSHGYCSKECETS